MAWRFRKVFGSGPFRWSLSKKGVGASVGLLGLRFGISPDGRRYFSFGLPGTGLYYIKYLGGIKPPVGSMVGKNSAPAGHSPLGSNGQAQLTEPWWKQNDME